MARAVSSSIPQVRSCGNMFLCCCYIANIEDIETCDDAWKKSVQNGWVRSDCYCNVSRYNLANKLNEIYGRGIKQGLSFINDGQGNWSLYNGKNRVYCP